MKSPVEEEGEEADFARTMYSRLRQVASRHEEILQNLDRADKLNSGKQKTVESTEMGLEQERKIPRDDSDCTSGRPTSSQRERQQWLENV